MPSCCGLDALAAPRPCQSCSRSRCTRPPLTIAELKAFVDSAVPAAPVDSKQGTAGDRRNAFRALLARRLVRSARFDEALPYFADPDMRNLVIDLRNELGAIADSSGIVKAQHAWQAAKLLRDQGMDLTGTEEWPDFHESGGLFASPDYTWDSDDPSIKLPQGATPQEAERVRQSAPDPDKRFHYRYVAFRLMTRAADSLPAKSQAYAAILCQSARLMFRTHEDNTADETWRRYIHTGAYIPTLHAFGRNCPDPDFAGAHHTPARLFHISLHNWIHRWKYTLLAAGPFAGAMFLLQRWAAHTKSRRTII